jgi:hypothetical protein
MTPDTQPTLFGPAPSATLPDGFKYQPSLITPAEESALVREIQNLPFKEFDFRGFLGKRARNNPLPKYSPFSIPGQIFFRSDVCDA